MKKSVYHRWLVVIFLPGFLLYVQNIFAQPPSIKTSVDKNNILIGGQFHYRVETSMPDNTYRLSWFTMPDTLGHFQVVRQSKIDSTFAKWEFKFQPGYNNYQFRFRQAGAPFFGFKCGNSAGRFIF